MERRVRRRGAGWVGGPPGHFRQAHRDYGVAQSKDGGSGGPGTAPPVLYLLRLIAVGRLRAGPELELFTRYATRLRPRPAVLEIAEGTGSPVEMRRREGDALLAALAQGERVVALDLGGQVLSSEAFAAMLQGWQDNGVRPAFLIGGAEGLSEAVLARADMVLSLGTLTWPHMLVRVLLAEQVFRAQCIASGHPYHRGFRSK